MKKKMKKKNKKNHQVANLSIIIIDSKETSFQECKPPLYHFVHTTLPIYFHVYTILTGANSVCAQKFLKEMQNLKKKHVERVLQGAMIQW